MNTFHTARLLMRPLLQQDWLGFYALHSDPVVMDRIPAPVLDLATARQKLEAIINKTGKYADQFDIYAVIAQASDVYLGNGILIKHPSENSVEIGYRLCRACWGSGYGGELAQGLIKQAFETTDATKVTAEGNPANKASIAILDKIMDKVRETINEKTGALNWHYERTRAAWEQEPEGSR